MNTSLGAEFLTLMLFNLFISEPQDAIQDVMEVNFGFQVTSIAGQEVGNSGGLNAGGQNENSENEEPSLIESSNADSGVKNADPQDSNKNEEKKEEQPQGEFSAMQQAERAKAALIEGKQRIFEKGVIDPIVSGLIADEIENFENLICQPILPTIIKAKLYELLSALIQVDDPQICEQIHKSKIPNWLIIDYSKYENNSNILILLNGAVKSMLTSKNYPALGDKILFEQKLIETFASKLNHSDYQASLAVRKNIYPFIHNFTSFLIDLS